MKFQGNFTIFMRNWRWSILPRVPLIVIVSSFEVLTWKKTVFFPSGTTGMLVRQAFIFKEATKSLPNILSIDQWRNSEMKSDKIIQKYALGVYQPLVGKPCFRRIVLRIPKVQSVKELLRNLWWSFIGIFEDSLMYTRILSLV